MTLLLVHVAATWYLVGLIWFVQVVHYPLMVLVGPTQTVAYEEAHTRRTTWSLAVAWPAEALSAALLVLATPPGVPRWMPLAGLVAVIGIAVSTVTVQVPAHERLRLGFDERTLRRLVGSNWVRTLLWTARGALALAMLAVA